MKANDAAKLQDAQSGGTTESIRRTHATAKPGSAPNSKIQLNCVKPFRMFAVLFSKVHFVFATLVQKSPL